MLALMIGHGNTQEFALRNVFTCGNVALLGIQSNDPASWRKIAMTLIDPGAGDSTLLFSLLDGVVFGGL